MTHITDMVSRRCVLLALRFAAALPPLLPSCTVVLSEIAR